MDVNSFPAKRPRRILGEGTSVYHVMSRVVNKEKILDDEEKDFMVGQMRILEAFMAVEILAYCIMGNHFHLLIRVPDKATLKPLTERELRDFLPVILSDIRATEVEQELDRAAEQGDAAWSAKILARFERRRGSMAEFMKSFKQRTTWWVNRRHNRVGTLWEGRYKSLLVDGKESAMMTVAAYIDLNPVRASIADRPEDYRWCSYAEALGKGGENAELAKRGLTRTVAAALGTERGKVGWDKAQSSYRCYLYCRGVAVKGGDGVKGRAGIVKAEVEEVLRQGGQLSAEEAVGCHWRYFIDGGVLGRAEFVEATFQRLKAAGWCSKRRSTGPRKMRGADWGLLNVFHDLRLRLMRVSRAK